MNGATPVRAMSDRMLAMLELLASPNPPDYGALCDLMSAAVEHVDDLGDALYVAFDQMNVAAITPGMADLIIQCCDLGIGPFGACVDEVMSGSE